MEQFIDNLLLSLNRLEVKGETNLNILLGCILAAKQLKAELANPTRTEEEHG